VVSHDAYDYDEHVFIGVSKRLGTPLFINREVAEADVKVSIGKIAPHADVGYSGGAKMIMPGVSYIWSIIHHHSGSYPYSGTLENPLLEDIEECGRMAGLDYIVNVVYNSKDEVLKAFSGHPVKAQRKGVEFGDFNVWGAKTGEKADIVVASPGVGNDEYFMEAMNCLRAVDKCLKEEGTIIVAASCSRGWSRKEYLESGWEVSEDVLDYDYPGLWRLMATRAWHEPHRQFQALVYYVQHVAKTCFEKDVVLAGAKDFCSEYAEKLNIKFDESIQEAVNYAIKKHGENSKIIVIPDSFTLPLERFHKTYD
jgi:nickel-dependent lactate racemase